MSFQAYNSVFMLDLNRENLVSLNLSVFFGIFSAICGIKKFSINLLKIEFFFTVLNCPILLCLTNIRGGSRIFSRGGGGFSKNF